MKSVYILNLILVVVEEIKDCQFAYDIRSREMALEEWVMTLKLVSRRLICQLYGLLFSTPARHTPSFF